MAQVLREYCPHQPLEDNNLQFWRPDAYQTLCTTDQAIR